MEQKNSDDYQADASAPARTPGHRYEVRDGGLLRIVYADVAVAYFSSDDDREHVEQVTRLLNFKDDKIRELTRSFTCLREALATAEQFIVNGIEFGFIRMPECADDSAHQTLPKIRAALNGVTQPATSEPEVRIVTSHALPVAMWDRIATSVVKRVEELPYRRGRFPSAMLVTSEELHRIIMSEFDNEIG